MKILSYILIIILFAITINLSANTRDLGVNLPGVKIDKHLYRSTAKIYQIIKYLRKKGLTSYEKESFDTPKVSVTHLKSLKSRTKWEGINIYRYKKLTYIYIIPRKK
jgi:hypothetical protein